MRLAAKLVLLFLVGLLLIVGVFAYLTIQQNQQLAVDEHQRMATDLAAAVESSVAEAVGHHDQAQLQRCLAESSRVIEHVQVRWVELDAPNSHRRPAAPVEWIIAQRQVTTVRMPGPDGHPHLYTYVPLGGQPSRIAGTTDASPTGRIEVSAPQRDSLAPLQHTVWSSLVALVSVGALSAVVILLGGVVMVGRPLHQLIEKVKRVGQGDFTQPLQLKTGDELGKLATAVNQMCDQLGMQRAKLETETASRVAAVEQLRHADRLNTVGRLAAGIAHEIGTPLNVVSGRAQLIASGQLDDAAVHESAETIRSEAQRITRIVRELLDFARQRTPRRAPMDVDELIASTVDLMSPMAARQDCQIDFPRAAQPVTAEIDASQIQQVLTNLIVNAVQSTHGQGRVEIRLSDRTTAELKDQALLQNAARDPGVLFTSSRPDLNHLPSTARWVHIEIQDNGKGVDADALEHLFEPFFTTKDVGEGTGLGLSISHGIIQEHQGWIEVATRPGQGSRFVVVLPQQRPGDVDTGEHGSPQDGPDATTSDSHPHGQTAEEQP